MKDGVWIIVDGEKQLLTPDRFEKDGTPKHHFDDRSAAWRYIDGRRDAAGCAERAICGNRPPVEATGTAHTARALRMLDAKTTVQICPLFLRNPLFLKAKRDIIQQ
jgi:hypothetical protein